jgi:HK97 family phage portal protein
MPTWWPFSKDNKQYEASVSIPVGTESYGYSQAPQDYKAYGKNGYNKDELIYACIRELANAAVEPRYYIQAFNRDNEPFEVPTSPLGDLLNKPNNNQDLYEMIDQMIVHLYVSGNAYLYKERGQSGRITQVYLLRPDRVSIKSTQKDGVTGYEYEIEGSAYDLPVSDVQHLKLGVNPNNDLYGLSPLTVLASTINLDLSMTQYAKAFFMNAGVPSGMLKLKKRLQTQEEANTIRSRWRSQFSTPSNYNSLAILDEDASYEPLSVDPGNMAMPELRDTIESRICMAFGIPPIIIGSVVGLDRATYSNYKEARRSFWDETMIGLITKITRFLNYAIADEFPGNDQVTVDFAQVRSLVDDKDSLTTRINTQFTSGIITLNEAREELGYDPIEDGSIRRLPLNILELGNVESNIDVERLLSVGEQKAITPPADLLPRLNEREAKLYRDLLNIELDAVADLEPQVARHYRKMKRQVDGVLGRFLDQELEQATAETKVPGEYPFVVEELIPAEAENELIDILGAAYVAIGIKTWQTIGESGLVGEIPVDRRIIQSRLQNIPVTSAAQIHGTTHRAVKRAIDIGRDKKYTIRQLAQGVAADNFPGISAIVTESYKNRPTRIARTEMSRAQLFAADLYYDKAGVQYFRAVDPDGSPSDTYVPPGEPFGRTCAERNGQIYTWNQHANIVDHINGRLTWIPLPNYEPPGGIDVVAGEIATENKDDYINLKVLPDNYRPADGEQECNNCGFYVALAETSGGYCEKWDDNVRADYVCNAWKPMDVYNEESISVFEKETLQ